MVILKRTIDLIRLHPQFRKNAGLVSTTACNFMAAILTGLVGILVSHLLGPHGRGIYATAIVWGSLLSFLVQMGINQSIVFLTASDPSSAGRITSATLTLLSLQSAVVVALAFGVVPFFAWYPLETRTAIQLYLCSIPAALLLIYLTCICLGSKNMAMFNAMKVVSALPPFASAIAR